MAASTSDTDVAVTQARADDVNSMYVDILVHTTNGDRICRREHVLSEKHTMAVVHALHGEVGAAFEHDVQSINVSECTRDDYDKIKPRGVYFVNICGKVRHCAAAYVLNPSVLPLVVSTRDSFGSFSNLYGSDCNLRVLHTNTYTIFRAARSSRGIVDALDFAVNPESIAESSVYMIVASARMAHPVCMQSESIDVALKADKRWHAKSVVKTEEGAHIRSVLLTDFKAEWVASLGCELCVPTKMLLNVTKNGGVNMFMSVHDNFRLNIEFEYQPLYQAVVDVVTMAS